MPAANMLDATTNLSRIGEAKGQFTVPDTIDAHNDEVAQLFHGGSPA